MVFFSWQDNGRKNFILGDIRKVMKARANAAKWDLWAAHPTQGRVVRGPVRAGDTKIMELALRRIRSMRKDYLLKFVCLVMTDLLPSDAMRPGTPSGQGRRRPARRNRMTRSSVAESAMRIMIPRPTSGNVLALVVRGRTASKTALSELISGRATAASLRAGGRGSRIWFASS